MSDNPRNPHEDPQRGDVVVARNGSYRRIVSRRGNDIDYYKGTGWKTDRQQESIKLNTCWITTWMEWCRKADLVKP